MKAVRAKQIAYLTGSSILGDHIVRSFAIDSRRVKADAAFVAIKGEVADGHDYLMQAYDAGARTFVISPLFVAYAKSLFGKKDIALIINAMPESVLQRYASLYAISHHGCTLIGVTGSCGKTTTKDMIVAILSQKAKTVKTPGNYNSLYGLPLSLLEMEDDDVFGVFEMGVDHIGEMAKMTAICPPEYAVITNIGISHLLSFGTQERIAAEKGQIFLPQTKGFVSSEILFPEIVTEGRKDIERVCNPFRQVISLGLEGLAFDLDGRKGRIPLIGLHNAKNASLAIALSRRLGLEDREIVMGLESLTPSFGRERLVQVGNVTVLEDCYNASWDSTYDALQTISGLVWKGQKNVVLGDMKELGHKSHEMHEKVGHALLTTPCDNIFLYGPEMQAAYEVIERAKDGRKVLYTQDFTYLSDQISSSLKSGDLMLLKGSRSMQMERVYSVLGKVS